MNFIRETDPYLRQLDAWKKGHGFSDSEALKRLADIWDEFKEIPERKKVIYGTLNSNIPKTDLSCGSCVHDLLTFVWNWRAALEHEVSTYFEGVQVAEVIEVKAGEAKQILMKGDEIVSVTDVEQSEPVNIIAVTKETVLTSEEVNVAFNTDEPVKMSFDVPQTFPEVEELKAKGLSRSKTITLDNIDTSEIWGEKAGIEKGKLDYSGLKMHQLRSLAKKKGIEYSNKTTSKELIELLNKKDNG